MLRMAFVQQMLANLLDMVEFEGPALSLTVLIRDVDKHCLSDFPLAKRKHHDQGFIGNLWFQRIGVYDRHGREAWCWSRSWELMSDPQAQSRQN